jgi:hypothetical protein
LEGKLTIGSSEGTDKVRFEGLYGPLSSIYMKVVELDKEIVTFFNSLTAKSVLAGEKLVATYSIFT